MKEERAQKLCIKDVPIGKSEDFSIEGPNGDIPARLYTPVDAKGNLPVVVFYHGGGWVIGSRDSHDSLCRQISMQGHFLVLSVDYRMGPEAPFPAAPLDCFAGYKWACQNIQKFGGNPDKIAVAGDSAGGNLSAVICIMSRSENIQPPSFQWLIYPATNMNMNTSSHKDFADGYFLTNTLMVWFQEHYLPTEADKNDWRASPLLAKDLSNLPPALVQTAGFDPLKAEGIAYAHALNAAGGTAAHTDYEGMIHGFINLGGVIDAAKVATQEGVDALTAAFA